MSDTSVRVPHTTRCKLLFDCSHSLVSCAYQSFFYHYTVDPPYFLCCFNSFRSRAHSWGNIGWRFWSHYTHPPCLVYEGRKKKPLSDLQRCPFNVWTKDALNENQHGQSSCLKYRQLVGLLVSQNTWRARPWTTLPPPKVPDTEKL